MAVVGSPAVFTSLVRRNLWVGNIVNTWTGDATGGLATISPVFPDFLYDKYTDGIWIAMYRFGAAQNNAATDVYEIRARAAASISDPGWFTGSTLYNSGIIANSSLGNSATGFWFANFASTLWPIGRTNDKQPLSILISPNTNGKTYYVHCGFYITGEVEEFLRLAVFRG